MRFGPGPLLFLAYWLLFMIAGRSRLFKDPGTFWHTRIGDLILERGFYRQDPLTFTHAGEYWIPHQWLGEVGMALLHRVAGFDTFLLAAATLLAGLFTWLSLRLMRTGLHVSVAVVITGITIAASATHLHIRPILFTTFALAVTAAFLSDFEDRKITVWRLYWLIPIYIIWTNIHGGLLGGLLSMGLVIFGWVFWRILSWPSPLHSMHTVYMLIVLMFLCTATILVNPYGLEIPQTWLKIMQGSRIADYIVEHQPLNPADPATWGVLLFAALYLFVLAGTYKHRPHVTWLLPLFWMLQMFFRIRHAPLFAMTGCIAIAAMWPRTIWAERLLKRPDLYDPHQVITNRGWWLPVLVVGLTCGLQNHPIEFPVIGAGWAKPDPSVWPSAILPEIRAHEPKAGRPARVFNDLPLGGWLSYHTRGYRSFIDDRIELYPDDMLDEYILAMKQPAAAMDQWQTQYGRFDFALVKPETEFDVYFSSHADWTLIAKCDSGRFYQRR